MTTQNLRRRRLLPLAAVLSIAALAAAACSSSSGGRSASSSTASASSASVNLSGVTLHIGDQAGSGAQARLTAAGLISKLPFKVTWSDFTSGPAIDLAGPMFGAGLPVPLRERAGSSRPVTLNRLSATAVTLARPHFGRP